MAAAPAVTFDSLRQQIAKGQLAPVYVLHGKESYFTDILVKDFEQVLPEADREFNQYILYGPQVEAGAVMDLCARFPMMADKQLVILKEAQSMRAEQVNRLYKYIEHPTPTTIFVLVFRGENAKGKDLLAACKKNAVVFESKEVRDYQMAPYITNYVHGKGLTISQKSIEMLIEFIGANLSNMANAIDKLATVLGKGADITPEAIEHNIGISKDYNAWELVDALSEKNFAKSMRIAQYFESNPKASPLPQITASLYDYYSNLLVAYYAKDKSERAIMELFKAKFPVQVRKYMRGMANYNAYQVIESIWALRQFDVRSKGGESRQNANKLFHDLIFHLITAPGNLGI